MSETGKPDWLPGLVVLTDYDGNWGDYLEALYNYFRTDFIESRPLFEGRRLGGSMAQCK